MSINYFQNSAESAESRVKLMSDEITELRISLESAERSLMEQDYLDECRKTTENTKILRKLERKLKGTQNH